MNNLEKAIVSTLKYHDKFDYPLSFDEIFRFLITNHQCCHSELLRSDRKTVGILGDCHALRARNDILQLVKKKRIIYKQGFYCLPGRKKIVEIRIKREIYSKEKLEIAKRIVQLFKFIPWIKMAGITGALAMNNARKDDDIDLMIITGENRLWLTRLWLIFILDVLGKRRKPNDKQVKDKLCLNLFLDEESLKLKKAKQNLFTAHEIVQMKPVLNRDNIYERFLEANLWVRDFLPNGIRSPACGSGHFTRLIQSCSMPDPSAGKQKSYILHLISYIFNLINILAYKFQYKFMKSKITNEEISIHCAFFHPKNIFKNL